MEVDKAFENRIAVYGNDSAKYCTNEEVAQKVQ